METKSILERHLRRIAADLGALVQEATTPDSREAIQRAEHEVWNAVVAEGEKAKAAEGAEK